MDLMVPRNKDVTFPFQAYGRPTCTNSDLLGDAPTESAPPSSMFTTPELLKFFKVNFGFSARETVAIMGAHTMGRLSRDNSGFPNSEFVSQRFTLDNEYYKKFFNPHAIVQATDSYQQRSIRTDGKSMCFWLRTERDPNPPQEGDGATQSPLGDGDNDNARPEVLLNSDMALISDFSDHISNPETGEISCTIQSKIGDERNECPMASTFGFAWIYSDDNDLWLDDFCRTFIKMTNTGIDTTRCTDGALCFVGSQKNSNP